MINISPEMKRKNQDCTFRHDEDSPKKMRYNKSVSVLNTQVNHVLSQTTNTPDFDQFFLDALQKRSSKKRVEF